VVFLVRNSVLQGGLLLAVATEADSTWSQGKTQKSTSRHDRGRKAETEPRQGFETEARRRQAKAVSRHTSSQFSSSRTTVHHCMQVYMVERAIPLHETAGLMEGTAGY